MDFDGMLLLIDIDNERFDRWFATADSLSLEELKNGYNEWRNHYVEARDKYRDLKSDDTVKDTWQA